MKKLSIHPGKIKTVPNIILYDDEDVKTRYPLFPLI